MANKHSYWNTTRVEGVVTEFSRIDFTNWNVVKYSYKPDLQKESISTYTFWPALPFKGWQYTIIQYDDTCDCVTSLAQEKENKFTFVARNSLDDPKVLVVLSHKEGWLDMNRKTDRADYLSQDAARSAFELAETKRNTIRLQYQDLVQPF